MASVASLPRPWLITDKHTFPRLARSTLNDLQQKQHETASFVCVRVQGPSGLALVPCALSMVDLSGQLRCWITHPWYRKMFYFLFLTPDACSYDPLWRGFFAWRQKTASVASLSRPCLIIIFFLWTKPTIWLLILSLKKDIVRWLPWMLPGSTGRFSVTILCTDTIY